MTWKPGLIARPSWNTIPGSEIMLTPELLIPKVKCVESTANYGRFAAEPLEPGFGMTLGNSFRRVLLSSLPGAAVSWLQIEGVQHEFSSIPYIKEDVLEFLLNVKEIRLRPVSHRPGKLILRAEGEGKVCAGDIQPSADFQVANPELYLATLDSPQAELFVEFNVDIGAGYLPARQNDGSLPVGALSLDAIFTPVYKANFSIESIRPGEAGSPERLIMEVWTDKTISPSEAMIQAAGILASQVFPFEQLELPAAESIIVEGGLSLSAEQYNCPVGDLGLSTRATNSLRRGGISTLGQLVEQTRGGLPALPGLGVKSQEEVKVMLREKGFFPEPPVEEEKEGEEE